MKISKHGAEHYIWGDNCDGWHLLQHLFYGGPTSCFGYLTEDEKGNLVSGETRLLLVSKMLPNDKSGITVPKYHPFWDSIGIVDRDMDG